MPEYHLIIDVTTILVIPTTLSIQQITRRNKLVSKLKSGIDLMRGKLKSPQDPIPK